jgi:type IV pilus assembly protein PilZ
MGAMAQATTTTGIIPLTLRTKAELYQAWMPFIQGGGLFVPSTRVHALGEEVFLLLAFMQDPEKIPLRGTVAWINPAHASGGRPQGIGVKLQGDPATDELRKRIEQVLTGVMNSPRPTHTI